MSEYQKLLGSEDDDAYTNSNAQHYIKYLKLNLSADAFNPLRIDEARVAKAINAAVKYAGNLNNLLPTGTFLFFQYVVPVVTAGGHCVDPGHVSTILTALLLATFTLWCFVLSFTDTVKWTDGSMHHGIATPRGMWIPGLRGVPAATLAQYRLRPIDFLHASVCAIVFLTSALFTPDVFSCLFGDAASLVIKFIPSALIKVIPLLVGFLATFVCIMWPSNRRSIAQPLVEKIADE